MNILGINASLRARSNSERLLAYVLDALRDQHAVSVVHLRDLKLSCLGCESCYADASFHDDGLFSVYERIESADLLVVASPTHFGMPSVLLKILMDRSNALWLAEKFKGKLGAVIVNGASRFGGIELCAKNIQHYFYDCGMFSVPYYACFNSSLNHSEERFPEPLPAELRVPLDKLAEEIRAAGKRVSA